MANYRDSVNLIVPTSSSEEKRWLLDVFQQGGMPLDDWALLPPEDRSGQDHDELFVNVFAQDASVTWGQKHGVWIETEEASPSDLVLVLRVFQLKFKKAEPIVVTFATRCSSPHLYSTTGTAVAIFRGEDWWFTPQDAAIEKIKQLGGVPLEDR